MSNKHQPPKHQPKHEAPKAAVKPPIIPPAPPSPPPPAVTPDQRHGTEPDFTTGAEATPPILASTAASDLPPVADPVAEDLLRQQAAADAAGAKPPAPAEKTEAPRVVLVHNTTARLMTVGLSAPVDLQRPVASSKTFQLLPGVNPVPVATWQKALQEKSIQREMEAGNLEELEANSLTALKPKAALELVGLTAHAPLLREWLQLEKREEVQKKIQAQLDMVAPSKRKDETEKKE